MACNPPLQFVQNGPAGTLPVTPLDPTPPTIVNTPSYTDLASSILDDLASDADGFDDAVAATSATVDTATAAAAAMDADLDVILALLAATQDTSAADNALVDFAGDQPGAEQLVGDVTGEPLPPPGQVPLVTPGGQATVTFGGSPATGGVPNAGESPYVLHVPIPRSSGALQAPTVSAFTGPNPPFAGVQGVDLEDNGSGGKQYFALLLIDPAQAGTFSATLSIRMVISITGITGVMNVTFPISVTVAGS